MAYLEITIENEPEKTYCATFFLGKAGNVVPGGHTDDAESAMHSLVHVLESRDLRKWAPFIDPMTPAVVQYMKENPTLTWVRFEVDETPNTKAEAAIKGMTAGTSVRRGEEYRRSMAGR
jgi:hypothetical protein